MDIAAGICLLCNVPIRADFSEKSEMISQLLFGETFAVLDTTDQWTYIRTLIDDYCGWVSTHMVALRQKDVFFREDQSEVVSVPFSTCHVSSNDCCLYIPGGSIFPSKSLSFVCEGKTYTLDSSVLGISNDVVALAKQYLGAPYLWGGKTMFGIDCSGLVQVVFRMAGKWLPRDAHQQEKIGKSVDFGDIQRGDLAFFENEKHHVVHVGILCDDATIIHASGFVRIDRFDRRGIFNSDLQRYTHQLSGIKRI